MTSHGSRPTIVRTGHPPALDSAGVDADGSHVTRRGGLWGLIFGLAGLGLGVGALLTGAAALAVAAGLAAATAGAFAAVAWGRLRHAEHRIAGLADQVSEMDDARSSDPSRSEAVVSQQASLYDGQSLVDPATGLFSEGYFHVALDARISTARRQLRPVSVVMLEVVRGLPSGPAVTEDPAAVANSIRATLREADTACRMSDGRFALVLEDTPENGAIWTVERVRRRLADEDLDRTLWAGVACYPAHGFDPKELIGRSFAALTSAKEWRQDRIEVAAAT